MKCCRIKDLSGANLYWDQLLSSDAIFAPFGWPTAHAGMHLHTIGGKTSEVKCTLQNGLPRVRGRCSKNQDQWVSDIGGEAQEMEQCLCVVAEGPNTRAQPQASLISHYSEDKSLAVNPLPRTFVMDLPRWFNVWWKVVGCAPLGAGIVVINLRLWDLASRGEENTQTTLTTALRVTEGSKPGKGTFISRMLSKS